ncbi:hypothetical protein RchiOBHm_Chr5g0009111 [Rosa chinensis]|uniref:Transmembrane protein n=1 Tax=Rosa chinensis TaxID=74649 RepID=A0A2P6Q499_ROSCH|nr:hypothetical protein RchiOBHm_Chr5g0009111 [Rosa chinensis]
MFNYVFFFQLNIMINISKEAKAAQVELIMARTGHLRSLGTPRSGTRRWTQRCSGSHCCCHSNPVVLAVNVVVVLTILQEPCVAHALPLNVVVVVAVLGGWGGGGGSGVASLLRKPCVAHALPLNIVVVVAVAVLGGWGGVAFLLRQPCVTHPVLVGLVVVVVVVAVLVGIVVCVWNVVVVVVGGSSCGGGVWFTVGGGGGVMFTVCRGGGVWYSVGCGCGLGRGRQLGGLVAVETIAVLGLRDEVWLLLLLGHNSALLVGELFSVVVVHIGYFAEEDTSSLNLLREEER